MKIWVYKYCYSFLINLYYYRKTLGLIYILKPNQRQDYFLLHILFLIVVKNSIKLLHMSNFAFLKLLNLFFTDLNYYFNLVFLIFGSFQLCIVSLENIVKLLIYFFIFWDMSKYFVIFKIIIQKFVYIFIRQFNRSKLTRKTDCNIHYHILY